MSEPSRRTSADPPAGRRLVLDLHTRARPAGIADEGGAVQLQAGVQHVHELVLVLGLHDHDSRHAPQVGEVEQAVMRRPVVGREAGAVEAEGHRQACRATSWMIWS
jgi:hypothetical protein